MKPNKFVLAFSLIVFAGCTEKSGEYAMRGAASGAVSGAVGGLISALVFGGDPVDRASRGAVYGGSVGAVSGAIAGSAASAREEKRREAQLAQLRRQIGDDAFDGLAALAECKPDKALTQARLAQRSKNSDYALAGLWLEVLTLADQRKEAEARGKFPVLIAADHQISDNAAAELTMRDSLRKLAEIRTEYGLTPVCKT